MIAGRDVKKRAVGRRFAGESALSMLQDAKFGRGREAIYLTVGQFSSIDWIDAILEYTGPASAVIATWTAANADLDKVEEWLGRARLQECSWIVDRSFPNRQPHICDMFRRKFGDDAIRCFRTHAKFSMIWNDDGWRVVALTSANLNLNQRVEFFHAADDPELFAQFRGMVDDVFAAQKPGQGFENDVGKATAFKELQRKGGERRAKADGILGNFPDIFEL